MKTLVILAVLVMPALVIPALAAAQTATLKQAPPGQGPPAPALQPPLVLDPKLPPTPEPWQGDLKSLSGPDATGLKLPNGATISPTLSSPSTPSGLPPDRREERVPGFRLKVPW
jgi:hypothetical protein